MPLLIGIVCFIILLPVVIVFLLIPIQSCERGHHSRVFVPESVGGAVIGEMIVPNTIPAHYEEGFVCDTYYDSPKSILYVLRHNPAPK